MSNSAWDSARQAIGIPLMTEVGTTIEIRPDTEGIGGFELSIRKEENLTLESDITDYVVESNSSLQDNIAIKPLKFTINGVVAEKVISGQNADTFLTTITGGLSPFLSLMPDWSSKFIEVIAEGSLILNELDYTVQSNLERFNFLQDSDNETSMQEKAFKFFYSAWQSRELLEVNMPWATISNCAIESVKFTQPAETKYLTNIEISFKQITFAQSKTAVYAGKKSGRSKTQSNKTGGANLSNIEKTDGTTITSNYGAREIK